MSYADEKLTVVCGDKNQVSTDHVAVLAKRDRERQVWIVCFPDGPIRVKTIEDARDVVRSRGFGGLYL